MSLGRALKNPDSVVSRFIDTRWPNWDGYRREVRTHMAQAATLKPSVPVPGGHWSLVGTAIDYRIRYYFSITPSEELIAYKALGRAVKSWTDRFHPYSNTPDESDAGDETFELDCQRSEELIGAYWKFFNNLQDFLKTVKPIRQRLPTDKERLLAQYCGVLARLDAYFRSHKYAILAPVNEAALKGHRKLLALTTDSEVEDICILSKLFYKQHAALTKQPAVLNPEFAGSAIVGGADGDLIVGNTLIDIKTALHYQESKKWFRQLIGYALLDFHDEYKITTVGLYLARQGLLLSWPLEQITRDSRTVGKAERFSDIRLHFRRALRKNAGMAMRDWSDLWEAEHGGPAARGTTPRQGMELVGELRAQHSRAVRKAIAPIQVRSRRKRRGRGRPFSDLVD